MASYMYYNSPLLTTILQVILPFILIFTVVFGVMQKAKIFGAEGKKQFNVMIALVMALAVVIPHILGAYPADMDPVNILNSVMPQVSLVLVAILLALLLIGIFGGEVKWLGSSISGVIALICFGIVGLIFANSMGYMQVRWFNQISDDVKALAIIILVFGLIVWFVTKDDSTAKANGFKEVTEGIGKLFGGGK
jgi:hypothetical protein